MSKNGWDRLGERLRYYRAEAGLTQEEVAERSGLSVRAIADIENGRTGRPRRTSLERIAEALQIPVAEVRHITTVQRQLSGPGLPDPAGLVPKQSSLATGLGPIVPRQLPALAMYFIGREAELKELDEPLDRAYVEMAGTTLVSAIVGATGVGKSALALRWAHRVTQRFPDGQLYVDLSAAPALPMTAADALAGFLRALGVHGPEIPPETGERAALYRSLMAGQRILVVADNATSVEQVRPLVPVGPRCVMVVTSRDELADLVAREGARRLRVDELTLAEALDLLRDLIGERVDADLGAAAALVAQCGRAPLALRVVAELVLSRPATLLTDVVSELAGQKGRLDPGVAALLGTSLTRDFVG